tara:strand:+ start:2402 stop:6286 length:3885 start_codon:yes stop_codon:yes gene_type:complete
MATNRFDTLYEFYYPTGLSETIKKGKDEEFLYEPIAERQASLRKALFDDEELQRHSVRKAIGDAKLKGIADREWIIQRTRELHGTAQSLRNNISTDERIRLKKSLKQGAMIKPDDVQLNAKQREALKGGRGYNYTSDQIKRQMLLEGNLPDDLLEDFTLMSGNQIMRSDKIPEEFRIEMQERVRAPQFKPPSTRGGPPEGKSATAQFFRDTGVGFLDVISAGGRFAQGLPAGFMRGMRRAEEAEAANGGKQVDLTNEEGLYGLVKEIDRLSYYDEGLIGAAKGSVGSMFKLEDAPQLAEELGFVAADYQRKAARAAIDSRRPDESKEETIARTRNEYQRMIKADFNPVSRFAMDHPGGVQLTTEILADPLNYVPIIGWTGAALKATGKVAAKAPGATKLLGAVAPEGVGAAARNLPLIKQARSLFYHSLDNNETIKKLGEFGASMTRAMKAGEDAGGAASRKVRAIGGQIDEMLSKASDKKKLIWKKGQDAEEITESAALFRVLNKGEGIDNLPKALQDIVPEVKKLSDELYDLSARRGQLNKVVGGVVKTASQVENYVPHRVFEGVGDIGKRVQEAGFADINAAAMSVRVDTVRKRSAQVERAITVKKKELAHAAGKEASAIRGTIAGLEKKKGALDDEFARMNNQLSDVKGGIEGFIAKGRNLDRPTRRLIHQLQLHASKTDIMGRTAMHRINPTSWAAVARKGGAKPIEDARLQWREHIRRESAVAGRAEEVSQLQRIFGKELSDIRGAKLLHAKALKKGEDPSEVAAALSEQTGLHYTTLSPDLKRAYMQLVAKEGTKVDNYQVFMPKTMASRLNEVIPKLSDGGIDEAAGAAHWFNQKILQPFNSAFRTSTTVLRSLAFHATNISGAVGLGYLSHGARMFDPRLQRGAVRTAHAAAFAGDPKAMKMTMRMGKDGDKVELGELYKIMEDYGVIGQSGLRFGSELGTGSGPLSYVAGGLQQVAAKKLPFVKTSFQQVASMGDDYQHAVAFLGYMQKSGSIRNKQDIYKALDFTAEYAGNYSRLTKFEKGTLRDVFAFYSWNRFILPHLVKQIAKNPARLAHFEKMRMAAEYQFGRDQPVAGVGVPDFLQLSGGFQAPAMFQPGENNSASNDVAMMAMETPIAALGALAPGFGGGSPVSAQLGPGGLGLLGMLTGFDVTRHQAYGNEQVLPSMDELEFDSINSASHSLFTVADSKFGKMAVGTLPFGEAMVNLSKLYMRHGMMPEAAEMWLRYRVGRDWLGLDNGIARGLSLIPGVDVKGLSIATSVPGLKLYSVDPMATAKRRKARAVEGM